MLADGIDLGNGRARVHQRPVSLDDILQGDAIADGLFRDGGSSAADEEDSQRLRREAVHQPQDGVAGPQRIVIGERVTAGEIAEAEELRGRRGGSRNDSCEARVDDVGEHLRHTVSCFADGDDQNAFEGAQVVNLITALQMTSSTLQLAAEGLRDAALGESMVEDDARAIAHLGEEGARRGVSRRLGHEG
jgi:hypothetical protein